MKNLKIKLTNCDTGETAERAFQSSLEFNLWVNRNYINHTWELLSNN